MLASDRTRRLALYPQSRGLAFVVLEGQSRLVDWGRYSIRESKARESLRLLNRLLERFAPEEVVLEDSADPDLRRCRRIVQLLTRVEKRARAHKLAVRLITRAQVSYAFRGRDVANKDDRALLLAQLFPQMRLRLPPRREVWMSENEHMAVFDAMALLSAVVGLPEEAVEGQMEKYRTLLS